MSLFLRLCLAVSLISAALLAAGPVPRPATDLVWTSSTGQKLSLSQYRGKVVALAVISTTCPHCQKAAEILTQLNKEFGPKGFQPLGYTLNDDANIPAFLKQFGVNFPVGRGSRDAAFALMQQSMMSQFYYPGLIFIDREGVIQAQYTGGDSFLKFNEDVNIRNQVSKMMATPSPAAAKPAPGRGKAKK